MMDAKDQPSLAALEDRVHNLEKNFTVLAESLKRLSEAIQMIADTQFKMANHLIKSSPEFRDLFNNNMPS